MIALSTAGLPRGFAQSFAEFRPEDFGGGSRRGLDNTEPLRQALNAAALAGGSVVLGPGIYELASTTLIRGAIRRPSGVTLRGAGADLTKVLVTGTSITNQIFDASGANHVLTSDIHFVGNGVSSRTAPYAGALMDASLAPSARSGMSDIRIIDCVVENFGSAAWLKFANQSSRFAIEGVGSSGCRWISRQGNVPGPADIDVPGHFIYFHGLNGVVRNVIVDDPEMDARWVKGGVALVGDVVGGRVHVGVLRDAGAGLASVDASANGAGHYAVMLYAIPRSAPSGIEVSIDRLEGAHSVGIYSAGAHDNRYAIGFASGQSDTRDATIYKGVLVIQGGRNIDATIGRVENSKRVVAIALDPGQLVAADGQALGITINVGSIASARGARDFMIGAARSKGIGGVQISGSRSGPAESAVYFRTGPGASLGNVDLSGLTSIGAKRDAIVEGGNNSAISQVRLPR